MPLYIYYCPKCDTEKEYIHKITEEPKIYCSKCKELMKRKLCGNGLLRFNGPGFYETDYKQKETELDE